MDIDEHLIESDVCVIIVAYFSSEFIFDAVEFASSLGPVVIIDNSEDSREFEELSRLIRFSSLENVSVVKSESNVGFGAGCKLGTQFAVRKFNPKVVLFCNPDIRCEDSSTFLRAISNFIARDDNYFQPLIFNDGQADSIQGLGYCNDGTLLLCYSFFKRLFERHLVPYVITSGNCLGCESTPIWIPSGACFFVKTEALDEINGFPDRTFLYFEEVLFAKKAREKGFTGYVDSNVRVSHSVGGTTGLSDGVGSIKMLLHRANSFFLVVKSMSVGWRLIGYPLVLLDFMVRLSRSALFRLARL